MPKRKDLDKRGQGMKFPKTSSKKTNPYKHKESGGYHTKGMRAHENPALHRAGGSGRVKTDPSINPTPRASPLPKIPLTVKPMGTKINPSISKVDKGLGTMPMKKGKHGGKVRAYAHDNPPPP